MHRKELETQLEELNEALLVSGDATAAQTDIAKKKDVEIARLRKEVEETAAHGDEALSGAKSKAAAALAEAADEVEAVKKAKAKSDKEKVPHLSKFFPNHICRVFSTLVYAFPVHLMAHKANF